MSDTLTLVLINYRRPNNVSELIQHYAKTDLFDQVLIADCSGSTTNFDRQLEAYVYRFNPDPGLAVRFAVAGLARTQMIMLVDDDLTVPLATIIRMRNEFLQTKRQVGLFGRQPPETGEYRKEPHYGESEVILTRATVVSQEACCAALWHTQEMTRELGGHPAGNGEDIILSYVSRQQTGKAGVSMRLPFQAYPRDEHAICRHPDHVDHRTAVVRWCRRRFGLPSLTPGKSAFAAPN